MRDASAAFCTSCGKRINASVPAQRANQFPTWLKLLLAVAGAILLAGMSLAVLQTPSGSPVGAISIPNVQPTAESRRAFAKRFDGIMLDAGIESTTTLAKWDDTVLYIKDPLAGRVRARQLQKVLPWARLKALGFTVVYYTNGISSLDDAELSFSDGWNVR